MRAGAGSSEDEALLTINLPVPWGEVPPEAELQLGLWLQPLSNAVVETDPLAVGGVVFGTQLGTCPPGGWCAGWCAGHTVCPAAGSQPARRSIVCM
jgi:hypothetical protein